MKFDLLSFSMQAIHLALTVALNGVIFTAVIYNVYLASTGPVGVDDALRSGIFLIVCSLVISLFSWLVMMRRRGEFRSIISVLMEGMIIMDADLNIQMVNPVIEKIFGYTGDELAGRNAGLLMSVPDMIGQVHELEGRRKDGTVFPAEVSVTEMQRDGKHIYVATLRDITNRKNTQAELLHYMRELEKSNHDLDDFAYIVSHDLKEPLRGLNTFSSFLLEDYSDRLGDDGKSKLQTIVSLTHRLGALLDALLYYSRVGKTELSVCETDLNRVVEDTLDVFSIKMKEAHATVSLSQKLPLTVCDHVRISEVFQNLIGNALKYNDKKENKIEIGFVRDHPNAPGEVAFYVRDSGIGIAKEHLEAIFKIFKRLHARDAYGGGTGSGLPIVKKIIQRHGGQIWAESGGKGQGSTFYFTLPQKK